MPEEAFRHFQRKGRREWRRSQRKIFNIAYSSFRDPSVVSGVSRTLRAWMPVANLPTDNGPRTTERGRDVPAWLARRRVALGFVCGTVVLWLAQPTWITWTMGCSVAAVGEAVRIWAAGHLEKDREVTSSGPYRFAAHPLYVGSTIIGIGFAIAASSIAAAALVGLYLMATFTAAVRREEAWLRMKFGDRYAAYHGGGRGNVSVHSTRSSMGSKKFSFARARQNREHRAVAGFFIVAFLLALDVALRT
jgi:protein-S-isoprenylcysteine O-methyltransferase Ste14